MERKGKRYCDVCGKYIGKAISLKRRGGDLCEACWKKLNSGRQK